MGCHCLQQDGMNHKWESRLLGDIINNLRNADNTTLMTEHEEELRSFLMRVKEESKKVGFKLNIQKANKILASGPITSGQTEEEKVETVIFLGSKITGW